MVQAVDGVSAPPFRLDDLQVRLEMLVGEVAAPTMAAVREPLELLAADLAGGALSPLGARLVAVELLRLLVIHSEIEELVRVGEVERVDESDRVTEGNAAPVFDGEVVVITGPPRTGSTFLHGLFALDPRNDHLTLARALSPTAPDEAAVAYATKHLALADRLSPRLRILHPMSANGPEECITAMQPSLVSERFLCTFDLPQYGAWLDGSSLQATYDWYSGLVGSLFRGSGCVVLKAPAHLARLEVMRRSFPNARFVVLSRDLDVVTDSFVELVAAARQVYADSVDVAGIRDEWSPRIRAAVDSVPSWATHDNDRVKHLEFDRLTADPDRAMEELYEWLGWVPADDRGGRSRRIQDLAMHHRRAG